MTIKEIQTISAKQKQRLVEIWNGEYPSNLYLKGSIDIDQFFMGLSDIHHYFLLDEIEMIVGWYCDFIRDEERWFLMILDQSIQGMGFGSKILAKAKIQNDILNGWVIDHQNALKIDGSKYLSPVNFYLKHSFQILPEVRLETDKISAVKIQWMR